MLRLQRLAFLSYLFRVKMKLHFGLLGLLLANGTVSAVINKDKDFALVGYAKTNPLGETTGGKTGATTTVTNAQALVTAVAVSCLCLSTLHQFTFLGKYSTNSLC